MCTKTIAVVLRDGVELAHELSEFLVQSVQEGFGHTAPQAQAVRTSAEAVEFPRCRLEQRISSFAGFVMGPVNAVRSTP
jgi:hypothetical protein